MLNTPICSEDGSTVMAGDGPSILNPEERHLLRREGVLLRKGRHPSGAWLVGYHWNDCHYYAWTRRPGGKLFAARKMPLAEEFGVAFEFRLKTEAPDTSAVPAPFDGQRKKIYKWEQIDLEILLSPMDVACLPADELEELAEEAFRLFNMPQTPKVIVSSDFKAAVAIQPNIIQIPASIAKAYVVLHECAHLISQDAPGHGPHFASVYIDLLSKVLGVWRSSLERSARLRDIYVNGSVLNPDG